MKKAIYSILNQLIYIIPVVLSMMGFPKWEGVAAFMLCAMNVLSIIGCAVILADPKSLKKAREIGRPLPKAIYYILDIGFISWLAYTGHFVIASIVVISLICFAAVYNDCTNKRPNPTYEEDLARFEKLEE